MVGGHWLGSNVAMETWVAMGTRVAVGERRGGRGTGVDVELSSVVVVERLSFWCFPPCVYSGIIMVTKNNSLILGYTYEKPNHM